MTLRYCCYLLVSLSDQHLHVHTFEHDFDCSGIINNLLIINTNFELQVDLTKETLLQQFQIVKRETNTSHVMQYGDVVTC